MSRPAGEGAPRPAPARGTILLVEDNEDNRAIYDAYLTHLGFTVIAAVDAESGLDVARSRLPDLVVMDVGLPGMDGNEATRELKGDPVTRHIPVLTLTAHALGEDRERALEAGCDHFLTKPLEPRALAAEVRRLLDASR